ncbi:MAG: hypothetical protein VXW76_07375 [Actinomycetota bacterium]|nr:hypothetical protein [Actinomycetota bacterium]
MVALPKPRPASASDIDLFEKDLRSEMRRLVSENMSLGDPESFDFAMPKGYTKESTGSALIGDTNIPDPMNNIPLMISDDPDIIRADRRRQAKEFGEGLALGVTTDLLGLPADILALVFRDAPQLAAALTKSVTTGTPVAEEVAAMNANPSLLDQALTVVQKYAGGDALAGYLGYSPEELQKSGVLAGRIGAAAFDPFVLLGAGSRAKQILQGEILPPEQGPSSQGIASQGPIIEGDINQEGIGTLLPAPRTPDLAPVGAPDTPTTTVPGLPEEVAQQPTRLQSTGDISLSDLPRSEVTGLPVLRTEVTERMATPEETAAFIRGEDPAEFAPTDEGIATLPAAEDVIDVEPVAQAALTPIRTEGQQQLRQQAFPITEDEAIFTPTNANLSPSGRTGIATIDDADPEILQITGPPADYSPTYQTIDRLEERAYTKEELIEILKAQPESAMRDLKGSGYLEYLESPYAPEVFDGPADIRLDYAEKTPQLKVRTVTNSEVEDYVNMADPSNAVKPPFTDTGGSIPNVDKQVLLPDSQARDRGVIILSNSNTKEFGGRDLRAVHDYFGKGRGGVPGYVAHARFEIPERNDGKVVASINEIQGNTVSTTSRKDSGYEKMTPLMAARHAEAVKNDDIASLAEAEVSVAQYKDYLKKYHDLTEDSFLRNDLLDEKPTQESYRILLENVARGMEDGKGVFSDLNRNTLPNAAGIQEKDFIDVVARTATAEDKAYINDLFERAGIEEAFDGVRNPDRIATFDDFFQTKEVYDNDPLIKFRVTSAAQRLDRNDLILYDGLKKELWFLFENFYSGPISRDFARRSLLGDPGSGYPASKKFITRMKRKGTTKNKKLKAQIDAKFGEGEYEKIKNAFARNSTDFALKQPLEDRVEPATVGQPFAVTRDFDEYMPRLIIQEMVKRGEVDELIFPNFEDLMRTGGRSSFSRDPAKRAGFKNTYDKGVKKGLNKIKAENPDFNFEVVENYELTPGKVLDHPVIKINLRDPAVRAIFEGRLIRRAKGGEVDLRPQKMIHSGIGAMAREMM